MPLGARRFAHTWDNTSKGTHCVPFLYMDPGFSEYIGVIGRTHGLDGTVVLQDTVGLSVSLPAGAEVGIGFSREFARTYVVREYHEASREPRLSLRGVDSAEAATSIVDQAVYVRADALRTPTSDRYAIGDIEGCRVITGDDGTELGVVTDVWLMPANDVWVVTRPDGSTIPLPVIDDVIRRVDLPSRCITVQLLPGLTDLDTTSEEEHDA